MEKIFKKALIIFSVIILFNCNTSNGNFNTKLIEIDIEEAIINDNSIKLSQITSKVDYVALETNDSCLLGSIEAIITQKYIIIISNMNNKGLYLFSLDGKFVKKIGKSGNGPGEYGNIGSVSFNENTEEILISTDNKEHIIKFKYDNSYSKGIKLKSNVGFVYNNSKIYAHKPSCFFKGNSVDTNQLSIFNEEGKIINKFHPVDFAKTEYIDMFIEIPDFSIFNNNVFYFVPKEDIIFNISENNCKPYYNLLLGKYKFPKDYRWDYIGYAESRSMDKAWIERSFVIDAYIMLVVSQKGRRNIIVYDKTSKKTYHSLTDDIDNISISYLNSVNNNKIVQCFEAVNLLNSEDKDKHSDKLKTVLKKVKETDNPILRIITLK
ncbi:MAG: 6-bladed beta-propeller, partial [Bacteroidales bacterium]|nr:6-bladed beta-propeller [Bacteroidales bacterium]